MDSSSRREAQVDELVAAYLEARQRGEQPDVERWFREHAEHADELRVFISDWNHGGALPVHALPAQPPSQLVSGQAAASQLGDFRVLRELGRGGMGIVYEAEQISLGRRVALKVLPSWAILDGRRLQRFQNEARAAARLQHPHIVPVIAIGCEQGIHFFAMRVVEGCSLKSVIDDLSSRPAVAPSPRRNRGEPTAATVDDRAGETVVEAISATDLSHGSSRRFFRSVAEIGAVAADALEHAHQCGVIHRDIKPSNLLFENNGHLWVSDFGQASIQGAESLTETGDMLGTLRYMSPEQAAADRCRIDERADVYSLGMTLYELVARRPAYIAQDRRVLLRQVLHDQPLPPSRFNPHVPPELDTIILTAIAKEPGDRYASAQALADDLRNFLTGRPLVARRPSLPTRATRWSQRHPAALLTTLAALAVTIAALTVSLVYMLRPTQQSRVSTAGVVPWDGRPLELDEGNSYSIDACRLEGADAEQAERVQIDWGDGERQSLPIGVVARHEFADGPAEFQLKVELLDSVGKVLGERVRQVKVRNVPPSVDIRAEDVAFVGEPTQIKLARPHDPGQDVILRCTVNWDDTHSGRYQTPATAIHTYDAPREATVRVLAEDEDGLHEVAAIPMSVLASRPLKPAQVVSTEWGPAQPYAFANGLGAFLHPLDGKIYVVRCVRENLDKGTAAEVLGLFRMNDAGEAEKIFNRFFISCAVPHPLTGDLFLNYSADRAIKRLKYGTWEETGWVTDLRTNDIDVCGYAVAPADYQGSVTKPLHVLAADRGQNGPKEILGFSAEAPQTDRVRVHKDQGILMDPVDVAISREEVFVADASGASDVEGRLFRLLPGGALERMTPRAPIGRPCGIAVKADNSHLFLADMQGNRVVQIDLRTWEVTELMLGLALSRFKDDPFLIAGCIRLSADEQTLVITDRGNGAIYLVRRK